MLPPFHAGARKALSPPNTVGCAYTPGKQIRGLGAIWRAARLGEVFRATDGACGTVAAVLAVIMISRAQGWVEGWREAWSMAEEAGLCEAPSGSASSCTDADAILRPGTALVAHQNLLWRKGGRFLEGLGGDAGPDGV